MSKINRMKMKLEPMAFDLQKVHESTQEELETQPSRSAAQCESMSDVLGYVWLGSWRDAEDPDALAKHGITHVLNVAKEVPSQAESDAMGDAMARANVESFQIPLVDAHSQDIVKHFETAFDFIEQAREHPNGKVLVHCRRGISRSPAIVVAYIMRYHKKAYPTALEFVQNKRPVVCLNLAFREILEDYDPSTPLFGGHAQSLEPPLVGSSDAAAGQSAHHGTRQSSQCMTEEEASTESDSKHSSQTNARTNFE